MVSTITPRVGGAVDGAPVNTGAGGTVQATNVAGINSITAGTAPAISRYYPNQLFLIRPANSNTGPVDLDFGPGALPWRKPSSAEHGNGDLSPSIEYLIKYDDDLSEFRTIAPLG